MRSSVQNKMKWFSKKKKKGLHVGQATEGVNHSSVVGVMVVVVRGEMEETEGCHVPLG